MKTSMIVAFGLFALLAMSDARSWSKRGDDDKKEKGEVIVKEPEKIVESEVIKMKDNPFDVMAGKLQKAIEILYNVAYAVESKQNAGGEGGEEGEGKKGGEGGGEGEKKGDKGLTKLQMISRLFAVLKRGEEGEKDEGGEKGKGEEEALPKLEGPPGKALEKVQSVLEEVLGQLKKAIADMKKKGEEKKGEKEENPSRRAFERLERLLENY